MLDPGVQAAPRRGPAKVRWKWVLPNFGLSETPGSLAVILYVQITDRTNFRSTLNGVSKLWAQLLGISVGFDRKQSRGSGFPR